MNCRKARQLTHLNRPGERTESESRAWHEHMAACPSCASESALVGMLAPHEQSLRATTTPPSTLFDVRARVLLAISDQPARRPRAGSAVRLAYAVILAAAAAWLGIDQWKAQAAHAELLAGLGRPAPASAGPRIVYTVDAATARALTLRGASLGPMQGPDGTIEVSQPTLQAWLESAPVYLVRTLTHRPAERAHLTKALQILQSAVDVSIRYRSKGV